MKRIWFSIVVLMAVLMVNAQDFSYLKEIDLGNSEELQEAEEAAMECCCYLVAVRYDKKDVQRQFANDFITKWASNILSSEDVICEAISVITEEQNELNNMYLAYYVMNYIDRERSADKDGLRKESLIGLIKYCSNSNNKLKPTKELKTLKQYHESGNLEEYLQDVALISL